MMVLLSLMMFAGLTEFLQMLIPGRSGNLLDFLADATGVLMGYWWYRRSTGSEWNNNKE
jgi:VanZ family protein